LPYCLKITITSVPSDFDFDRVLGDIVMAEIIDENEFGEIMRNGVWVSQDITKKLWRKAKVYLVGPDCKGVNVGDIVVYPSDKGIPMVKTPKKYIFLNKERIFGVLKPETISV